MKLGINETKHFRTLKTHFTAHVLVSNLSSLRLKLTIKESILFSKNSIMHAEYIVLINIIRHQNSYNLSYSYSWCDSSKIFCPVTKNLRKRSFN